MVIWQVLTRKLPYADDHDGGSGGDHQRRNLHGVIEAILANRRPPIPSDCPPDLAALIKKCWHRNPAKRPDMTAVISLFWHSGLVEWPLHRTYPAQLPVQRQLQRAAARPEAVVDQRLNVIGVRNLKIADASVLAAQVGGGNAFTANVIGARAADFVLADF
ncbi:uncharacterized protein ACA1_132120 [Acanthamoeba castellanii str. Neff]|uniref:Uncharacterized protein n=1 Tax=Acanthamoeba castellanii (strain ATCC 30010 / Neff) TaxID=1257118 RepID=L8GV06_ACACF|nr:uncharacterized protein ACA1_132120 [Acanthamoeba castellanii str. Neff]ELR17019.1 hypothetical protein ACA1_132120 [Acanthamoeba castellanii str. Neff]